MGSWHTTAHTIVTWQLQPFRLPDIKLADLAIQTGTLSVFFGKAQLLQWGILLSLIGVVSASTTKPKNMMANCLHKYSYHIACCKGEKGAYPISVLWVEAEISCCRCRYSIININ